MLRILIPVLDSLNSAPARQARDWRVPARRTDGGAPAARAHPAFAPRRALDIGQRPRRFHREAAEKVLRPVQSLLDGFHIRLRGAPRARRQSAGDRRHGATARGRPHRARRSARQLAHPVRRRLGDRESDRLRAGAGRCGGRQIGRRGSSGFGVPVGFSAALGLLWIRSGRLSDAKRSGLQAPRSTRGRIVAHRRAARHRGTFVSADASNAPRLATDVSDRDVGADIGRSAEEALWHCLSTDDVPRAARRLERAGPLRNARPPSDSFASAATRSKSRRAAVQCGCSPASSPIS